MFHKRNDQYFDVNQLGQTTNCLVSPISGLSNDATVKQTGNKKTLQTKQDGDLNKGQLHNWVIKIKLVLVKVTC
jgi:hypothetical protein